MAKSKKPYMAIETHEEFEKIFYDIFNSGKEQGFQEGLATGLSYLYDVLEKMPAEVIMNAKYISGERRKKQAMQAIAKAESNKKDN